MRLHRLLAPLLALILPFAALPSRSSAQVLIDPTAGGTGVSNAIGSTITLGGAFQMSGAYTFVGTLTANTAVTFPTSGLLSTTTGTVTPSGSITSGYTAEWNGATTIIAVANTGTGNYVKSASPTLSGTVGISGVAGTLAIAPTTAQSSGQFYGLTVNPTIAQTGTAGFIDLDLAVTQTSFGSGTNYLIYAPSVFTVDYSGNIVAGPKLTLGETLSSLTDNGSGGLTIASAGTNQKVVVSPSGTGTFDLLGNGANNPVFRVLDGSSTFVAELGKSGGQGWLSLLLASNGSTLVSLAGGAASQFNWYAVATGANPGLIIANPTASTSGATQQYSPAQVDIAHVWNTTATAADNYAQWLRQVTVTSGTSPTSEMDWYASISATSTPSYSKAFGVTSAGLFKFNAGIDQTFNPNSSFAGLNVGAVSADPGTLVNGDIWYNSTGNALNARINGATVSLGSGGGAVSSVANSDGTLTISPTTGSVVASIALGHANTWTGAQTMGQGILQATLDYVQVVNSTDVALSTSYTSIPFDTNVNISNAAMHSTSSNNTRLIAATAGWYDISISPLLTVDSTTTGVFLRILKNGTTILRITEFFLQASLTGQNVYGDISPKFKLAAGDYVEIQVLCPGTTSGAVWRNGAGTTYPQSISMTKISN